MKQDAIDSRPNDLISINNELHILRTQNELSKCRLFGSVNKLVVSAVSVVR